MKKTLLLFVLLLVIQPVVMAQAEFSVKAGVSSFYNRAISFNGWAFGDHYGFEVKFPLEKMNFLLSAGLDIHNFSDNFELSYLLEGGMHNDGFNLQTEINRSVPLLIHYRLGRFDTFLGYEPMLVKSAYGFSGINNHFFEKYTLKHELVGGTEFTFSNSISIAAKLYMADLLFRKKYESLYGGFYKESLSATVDFSIKYYINRDRGFNRED